MNIKKALNKDTIFKNEQDFLNTPTFNEPFYPKVQQHKV